MVEHAPGVEQCGVLGRPDKDEVGGTHVVVSASEDATDSKKRVGKQPRSGRGHWPYRQLRARCGTCRYDDVPGGWDEAPGTTPAA